MSRVPPPQLRVHPGLPPPPRPSQLSRPSPQCKDEGIASKPTGRVLRRCRRCRGDHHVFQCQRPAKLSAADAAMVAANQREQVNYDEELKDARWITFPIMTEEVPHDATAEEPVVQAAQGAAAQSKRPKNDHVGRITSSMDLLNSTSVAAAQLASVANAGPPVMRAAKDITQSSVVADVSEPISSGNSSWWSKIAAQNPWGRKMP